MPPAPPTTCNICRRAANSPRKYTVNRTCETCNGEKQMCVRCNKRKSYCTCKVEPGVYKYDNRLQRCSNCKGDGKETVTISCQSANPYFH